MHLHAGHPRTFEAWRAHLLHTPADAVVMLGDLFEVWVGDDAGSEGFEAECVEVLAEAARHRALAFMVGNRDFLAGPALAARTGWTMLADPTRMSAFGRRMLLSHGDALCLSDADYQRFRAEVREAAWQRDFLARPLAQRRAMARAMRDASAARQAGLSAGEWADVDAEEAAAWLRQAGCTTLLHGHTHRPGRHRLAGGGERVVLSDWEFDGEPRRGDVLRWTAGGLQRIAPVRR